jgi:hypothetical protein
LSQADFRRLLPVCCPARASRVRRATFGLQLERSRRWLNSCDLPFGAIELHEHPGRLDDSDENAVAEIGDGPGNALHLLEPGEDEGGEPEEGGTEDGDEDRSSRVERDPPETGAGGSRRLADSLVSRFTEVRRL